MPVLITCKVCKQERITASPLLADTCEGCVKKAVNAQTEAWEKSGRGVRAGDLVRSVTRAMGIPHCSSCGKRQAAMNAVNMDGPAMQVFMGLAEAIVTPEKVLEKVVNEKANDRSETGGSPGRNR